MTQSIIRPGVGGQRLEQDSVESTCDGEVPEVKSVGEDEDKGVGGRGRMSECETGAWTMEESYRWRKEKF